MNERKKSSTGKKGFELQRYTAVAFCILIAVIAMVISKYESYVSAPMLGLIIGIILVNIIPDEKITNDFRGGTNFAGKRCLSLGIIFIGATLSFTSVFSATYVLPLVVFNVLLSFAAAHLIGRKVLKLSPNVCTLIGGGTCICGGSAIAALSPTIRAKEEETAFAMAAIFFFDLLACLIYPYLAIKLGLSENQFGILAGTAINDTSSVVAAQETFAGLMGLENYTLPAMVKVVRTTLIIVLVLVFSLITMHKDTKAYGAVQNQGQKNSLGKILWKSTPKFILFFLAAVALNTVLSNMQASALFYKTLYSPFFSTGYKFFVTIALVGVGFKIKFRDIISKGLKPILLGGCTWISLFISSLLATLLLTKILLS